MSAIKEQFLSQEQISERAYELYLERGGEGGHALEDWFAAEDELKALKKEYDEGDFPLSKKAAAASRRRSEVVVAFRQPAVKMRIPGDGDRQFRAIMIAIPG
jgi:hypothetical protein